MIFKSITLLIDINHHRIQSSYFLLNNTGEFLRVTTRKVKYILIKLILADAREILMKINVRMQESKKSTQYKSYLK